MRDIQFRPAQRACFCRGCDKEIAPNTEKIITFYSFRNRGQHIHICVPCVESFNDLISEEKLSPPSSDDLLWTTKEGQKIMISEMKDSHLQNAHAMLTKKLITWAALENELQKRKLMPKEVVFNFVPRPSYLAFVDDWMGVDEEVMF